MAEVIRYTTAPAAYDGFGTRTLDPDTSRDGPKVFRRVSISDEHLTWQEGRYGSGMHGCFDEVAFRHLLDRGIFTAPPAPTPFNPITCGCGASVPFAAVKCDGCGKTYSHRFWYPSQYTHPLIDQRVTVVVADKVVASGAVVRVVESTRFGPMALLDTSGDNWYRAADCRAAEQTLAAPAVPDNVREAARLFLVYTGQRGRLWSLAGSGKSAARGAILAALRGRKVVRSECGINALSAALYEALGIVGTCEADRETKLAAACRAAASS